MRVQVPPRPPITILRGLAKVKPRSRRRSNSNKFIPSGGIPGYLLAIPYRSGIFISMNLLAHDKRVSIVTALVEGNSMRATARMAGVSVNSVMKLVVDMGQVCQEFHDETVVAVAAERVQADEVWSFCYAKQKNLPDRMRDKLGVERAASARIQTVSLVPLGKLSVRCSVPWRLSNRATILANLGGSCSSKKNCIHAAWPSGSPLRSLSSNLTAFFTDGRSIS